MTKTVLFATSLSLFILGGCGTTSSIIKYNIPDITDVDLFHTASITKADGSFTFPQGDNISLPHAMFWSNGRKVSESTTVEQFLENSGTTAFLVIRNDSILYEKYFHGYSREKLSQVFSVTKSVVSALVGIAVAEGNIQSVEQPVSDFLPYFKDRGREKLTLDHLLQMTAGLSFSDYKTFGKLINFYYCNDQECVVKRLHQKYEPGTKFSYSSIATQILGMCLEKATGKPVPDYLQEKLWAPMGMEYDAKFALDREDGTAKMFGGLSASAIDLAKLGRLYLNNGSWNGTQLVPEEWVLNSRTVDTTNGGSRKYAYCWWLDTYPRKIGYCQNDFFAGGFRGQVVYVNPNDNTIIVRLGKKESGIHWGRAISKLALLQECENDLNPSLEVALEGDYKSKNGHSLNLKWLEDKLVLEDIQAPQTVELKRTGKFTFSNKDHSVKVIVNYRDRHIQGLIVERGSKAEFLEKI